MHEAHPRNGLRLFTCQNAPIAKGLCMKLQRHNAIRELLTTVAVTSQDELRKKLARRGFHVTQATLSRDIRELKLLKGPSGYALPNNTATDSDDDPPLL